MASRSDGAHGKEGNRRLVLSQVHNVSFAFELMLDGGLQKPKARPEGKAAPGPGEAGSREGRPGPEVAGGPSEVRL